MPYIKDENGKTVYYKNCHDCDLWTDKGRGSWDIRGGVLIIKDGNGNIERARALKPGEKVYGID